MGKSLLTCELERPGVCDRTRIVEPCLLSRWKACCRRVSEFNCRLTSPATKRVMQLIGAVIKLQKRNQLSSPPLTDYTKKEAVVEEGFVYGIIFGREVRSLYRPFAFSRHPRACGQTCLLHPAASISSGRRSQEACILYT